MSEQAATAEPVSQDTGGQTAPETSSAPAPETSSNSAPEPQLTLDQLLSKRYDELQTQASFAERDAKTGQPASGASEPAQSSPAIAPPRSWSAGYQEQWSQLPPAVQQYISQRESEAHQQISRQGSELSTYQPLRDVYGQMHQMGVPQGQEHEYVSSLMRADAFLRNNPVEGLKWLAQSFNVNPALLNGNQAPANGQTSAVDDLFKDPRVDALLQRVQQQDQYIRQLGGQVTAREQIEQSQKTDYANDLIQQFANGKADFLDLQEEVAREAKILKETNPRLPMEKVLEQAYDRARWANPANRERILSEQRATEAANAQKEAVKKQAEAQRHRAMNVRTGVSASTPTFDGHWDDKDRLGALYDRIQSSR